MAKTKNKKTPKTKPQQSEVATEIMPPAASAAPTKARTVKTPVAEPRMVRSLFRPWRLALLATVLTAAIVGPRFSKTLSKLMPDVSERAEYQLRTRDIEVSAPPHWVPFDLLDQVIEQANLPEVLSLLDDHLTTEIAQAFELHPWVAKVERVTKSVPAMVHVELVFRRPAAMVQVPQGLYPIDSEGVLLPPADFSVADAKRYPLVVNAQSTPQGAAGHSWGDEGVIGAARLADTLQSHWKEFNLLSIEIPTRGNSEETPEGVYYLRTVGGSRVVWGRAPGSQHPGELSAEQKIGRMEEYVSRFGGFDQPSGPYIIDIRHWQEITRRPLAFGDKPGVNR